MNLIKNGWFNEVSSTFPGQAMSIEIKEKLIEKRTKFQDLLIFESTNHGRVLVLDGIIQLTEKDEFMYQEMISFLPLNCHRHPENILIIGGGDGGVAREVSKHPLVKYVTQVEIDEDVIKYSKMYLRSLSVGYDNPKVNVIIGDGFQYLRDHEDEFDMIITDSTDPEGPGEVLFDASFYKLIHKALKCDGIMCSQGQNVWLELEIIKNVMKTCRTIFPVVSYAKGTVPTYTNGEIGYVLCSKDETTNFREPIHVDMPFLEDLKYYSPEVHRAAFVMPNSVAKELNSKL